MRRCLSSSASNDAMRALAAARSLGIFSVRPAFVPDEFAMADLARLVVTGSISLLIGRTTFFWYFGYSLPVLSVFEPEASSQAPSLERSTR